MNADVLENLLRQSNYDPRETKFLVSRFRNGFDLHYEGTRIRRSNIPFSVGNAEVLWGKLIKEVKLNQVAGPFNKIPFQNYIQLPVGLVPKVGSDETRLIFHLSYKFGQGESGKSVNECIPHELCTVVYNDLDYAVKEILILRRNASDKLSNVDEDDTKVVIYMGKSDVRSAFRVLPLSRRSWPWLIMIALNPKMKKWQYFVNKCLPFGASISCALFQRVSNAIRHIVQYQTGSPLTNYLDDFLFYAVTRVLCNHLLNEFLRICGEINFPISLEKTEWASEVMVFLGILLNGKEFVLSIPLEK